MRSNIGWYIGAAFLLVLLAFSALVFAVWKPATPEIIIGMTMIVGVSVLVLVLFIMAAGFTAMKMNDPQQALGLPEGSIRAMIALMLIVIWVIMVVFLITVVGNSAADTVATRLAQQVETTIGTLVVAVAAFYFGSRSVESAVSALAAGQRLPPVIEHVDPSKGDLGTDSPLTITGRNFRSPTVKLVSAANNKEIVSKGNPLSNDTTVNCTMTLGSVTDTDMIGDWALLVVNDDGQKHQLEKAFEITRPAAAP